MNRVNAHLIKMESNYNNYTEKKPIGLNPGFPQSNMQTNPNLHHQPMSMSGNMDVPWNTPTQSWQNSYPHSTPPRNNSTNPGYMVSPMNSPTAGSNQQWPNSPPGRLVASQTMQSTSMIGKSPVRSPYPPWPSTPPRAMHPQVNPMMTTSAGSPSRTAPPSWPSSSPRASSTFVVQPPSTARNNTGMLVGQQV